jgi:hypothetical protein
MLSLKNFMNFRPTLNNAASKEAIGSYNSILTKMPRSTFLPQVLQCNFKPYTI